MYTPPAFAVTNRQTLFDFIEQQGFGMLVSQRDGEPFVSHLPFLLDRSVTPHGRLVGHMARANPQWQQSDGASVLVVFRGPHAYISPTWYREDNVVPTWNYVVAHAYGQFRAIHDPAGVLKIVAQTVKEYEASQPSPWVFDDTTENAAKLARQIVGFDIAISRVEGKWKLSQNHSERRRTSVISALSRSAHPDSHEIADLMQTHLDESSPPSS